MPQRFLVLRIEATGESYLKIHLLGPDDGLEVCLKRVSRKKISSNPTPDLFDTAEIELEYSKQGTMRFVKEYQLVERRSSIGQSYQHLQRASAFCNLLVRNGTHLPDQHALYQLTNRCLNAFNERSTPAIVYLKSLFVLLKEEGFPVREDWWPKLPPSLKTDAKFMLENPCPETVEQSLDDTCVRTIEHLHHWIQRETEISLDC